MGLDGGHSIGMPKSSSESSWKSEFSKSEFVALGGGGIKSKSGIDMVDGGREGLERGIWGWERGILGWREGNKG